MPSAARLLRLAGHAAPTDPTDTELLHRYAVGRDEAAFAELVRRNGPLVLRACRHVLGEAGADDAFQATFLLLARSPSTFTRPGSLAGWLHAAAVRVARNARRADDRRRRRESVPRPGATAADDLTWREVREVLDAEIAALPERDRLPLVLCYLQELSYEDAARRAGCTVAALRGRLERGKKRLRARLARHGLPLVVPALLAGSPPAVSAAVAESVVAAVRSAGRHTFAGLLRARLVVPLGAALVAVGFVLASNNPTPAPQPAEPPKNATAAPATDRLGDPLPPGALARLGTRRMFGPSGPRWAAYSPDGTRVAAQSSYAVTVLDADTGRQLAERTKYEVAGGAIGWRADGVGVAVVRLPDHSYFVSNFTDTGEKLPDPPRTDPPPGRGGPDGLELVALSPDTTRVAVVRDPDGKQFTIDVFPATIGRRVTEVKPLRTLGPFPGPCQEVRFTRRGVQFLSGSWKTTDDWTLAVADPDGGAARTITVPPPAYYVWGLMYSVSPDGRRAAIPVRPKAGKDGRHPINEHDGTIRVWDLDAGKELRSFPFADVGYGTGHAFTPDGTKLIVAGDDPYVRVWDLTTGKEAARTPKLGPVYPHYDAAAVAVRPDGKRFVTGRLDGRFDVFDTATAAPVVRLDTHRQEIASISVSPDGKLAATLGKDHAVRVWEVASGKPVCAIPAPHPDPNRHATPPVRRAVFTPDGRGLLFVAGDELALADPLTGKLLALPPALRGVKEHVGSVSADTLVTFAGDKVTLRDWPTGAPRRTITVPLAPRPKDDTDTRPERARVDHLVPLSADGRFLFTNSVREPAATPKDGGVQNANDLWDARTGKLLHRLESPMAWYPPAAFSPDGRTLYLGGHSLDDPEHKRTRGDSLTAWDAAGGKLLRKFVEPDRPGPRHRHAENFGRHVQALAVSPDGRLVAVAETRITFDGVWVYEAASGRPLKKLAGHDDAVTALAFTPDGRRLVSVGDDQTGLVWDVTLPALVTGRAEKGLPAAWDRLAGADPVPGYLGIAVLAASPAEAVAFLKERLRPAPIPTDAELDRLTARLAADEFADREEASAALEVFGPNAVAGAKARLAVAASLEARDRLNRFLARYAGPSLSPYELRAVRGVAALEAIGTPEAKALLAELGRGKSEDVLTREAARRK